MARRIDWSGNYVVCVTPFTAEGDIDEGAMRRLVGLVVSEGAQGLVVAGSTGEFFSMSEAEKGRLFQLVADENRGRLKLIAGTTDIVTSRAVALTEVARSTGFDGALVLPQPYILPTEREVLAHFAAIAEVGLPLMLYNNPARTGVNLHAELLSKCARLPQVTALKDSVKDIAQLSATLRAFGNELAVFTGLESYWSPMMQRGAAGVVSMAPNVMGREAIELTAAAKEDDARRCAQIQDKIDLLYDAMYGWSYNPYVVIKEAMRLLGRPGGYPRRPLLPMMAPDVERLRALLSGIGAVPQQAAA